MTSPNLEVESSLKSSIGHSNVNLISLPRMFSTLSSLMIGLLLVIIVVIALSVST